MKKIEFNIGNARIGGDSPILVQTMCNTDTNDIERSVEQCKQMAQKGAQLIRLTTQGLKEVESLAIIKQQLRDSGITTPLVADIHFNSEVAIAAAKVVEKVRINPGNFGVVHKESEQQFKRLIQICKAHNTAIRIGLNHGSLGEDIVNRFGNTPEGMKEAVMQWVRMCQKEDFNNIVLSLKASNTIVMSQAYTLLYKSMIEDGYLYPLHLGVTEAGNSDTGRIKSAIGIGTLLRKDIGNTIRVSLTENPVNEIDAGYSIVNFIHSNQYKKAAQEIEKQICEGKEPSLRFSEISEGSNDWNDFIIRVSILFGTLLLKKRIDNYKIEDSPYSEETMNTLKENILQAARRKFYHPEYIACPGCGRTKYNLEKTFNRVKEKTAHLKGVKIAVMGCIVNGPGEMADADYGYVGQGGGKVTIYKGKEPVYKGIEEDKALDLLIKVIEENM